MNYGTRIQAHVAHALYMADRLPNCIPWSEVHPDTQTPYLKLAGAALGSMQKYSFMLDRAHHAHIPHHEVSNLIAYLQRPNGYFSPVRDVSFQAGSGVWINTFPWTDYSAFNDSFRHPLSPVPNAPTVVWGVKLDDEGSVDYYDTEDEARTHLKDGWGLFKITTEEIPLQTDEIMATTEEIERHAEKQEVPYSDAWRSFERLGYDMSQADQQYEREF